MPVALSDMSRDALVRELRIAYHRGKLDHVVKIKQWLAIKNRKRSIEANEAMAGGTTRDN